ncbi:MAG TPA: TIR domain-containing protein [Opitutus sp.]|nr:TIR domain-containing protein [Opitutus sp.]
MSASRTTAVFLSYAHEDAPSAKRIADALRAGGIEVWLDEDALRGGDAWDQKIRRQIRDCALFVPLISASTQARREGYFRLEWRLAVERMQHMDDDLPFLVPVVIDGTPDARAFVPEKFRAMQWTRLPGGETPPEFRTHVARLLRSVATDAGHHDPVARGPHRSAAAATGRRWWPVPAALAAFIGALAVWHPWSGRPPMGAPTNAAASPAGTPPPSPPPAGESTPTTDITGPTIAGEPDARSVAVLAFANLSDDKDNEYFSDGISEELLTVLQKIPGLRVAARTSAFSFKGKNATAQEIGERLHVANLVEGSVRKVGNSLRITARLSRAATGEQVWSESYTRDAKDVFAVQAELAQTIVAQLRGRIGGPDGAAATSEIEAQVRAASKGGTRNPEAHQLYLQGRFFQNQLSTENLARAVDYFQRAVALDPGFALGWAQLSLASSVRGEYADTKAEFEASFALARQAAARALQLEPELAAANLAKCEYQWAYDFDWKGAQLSLNRALALAPNDAGAIKSASMLARAFGQMDRMVELGRQAVALDPVNPSSHFYLAFNLLRMGRYDEADEEFRQARDLNPNSTWSHAGPAQSLILRGRFDAALAEAAPERTEWARLFTQALAYWGGGKTAEADATLQTLIDKYGDIAAYQVAEVYAYRGEASHAFAWLDRAYAQRDPGLAWSKSDMWVKNLHADPRWAAFMHKLGLSDEQLL